MIEENKKTMFTVESKSMLAKLMATENIKVVHKIARTASFDLKTRTLTCPIWKDMSGDLYDLLMGHEISHALNTPEDGWHDSIVYAGGNKKATPKEQQAFRNFLNVVEDARIEKLVKRQYPGLRKPMINGYKSLLQRDFFGLSAVQDMNSLYLIDKLNLSTKLGTALPLRFTEEETPFYTAIQKVETWADVVELATRLYDYSKTEQHKGELKKNEELAAIKQSDDESFAAEGESGEETEDYENEEGGGADKDSEGKDSDEDSEGKDSDEDSEGKDSDEESQASKSTVRSVKSNIPSASSFVPQAKTDVAFRAAEEKLNETKLVNIIDLDIPTPDLSKIVVPQEIVNKSLTEWVHTKHQEAGRQLLDTFKRNNADYVASLAKEFEMKKAARSYAKVKIADSGDIDIKKLANYRLEDTIFRKMIKVQKGKSHGLVLILDKSGSMHDHIKGATEQILVLAMFCRKVNIPFVAYSFTSPTIHSWSHDFKFDESQARGCQQFSTNPQDIILSQVSFRELLNSNMRQFEFNQAIMNQLCVAEHFDTTSVFCDKYTCSIPHERMGSTPLIESLITLRDLTRTFKKNHRLDLVNLIVMHDGDADNVYQPSTYNARLTPDNPGTRITLHDTKEKLSIAVPSHRRGVTCAIMKWIQMTTGCGVFGFYITGKGLKAKEGIRSMYANKLGIEFRQPTDAYYHKNNPTLSGDETLILDQLTQTLQDEKFLESYTAGYTRFYFLPGSEKLQITKEDMKSPVKWTPGRLLTEFKKVNKKKKVSRVLVNRFIEMIAT
jgi:cobalamin biosynthesis protein CobT